MFHQTFRCLFSTCHKLWHHTKFCLTMAAMRPETSTIHDLVCVCNLFRYSRNPSCCRHFNFDYKTYSILKISIFHRFKRTSNVNGKKQRKRVVCGADRQPTNAVLLHTQFGKKPNENRNGVQLVWLFESFSSLYITAAYKMLKFQNGSVGSALKNMRMKNVAGFLFVAPLFVRHGL